MTNHINYYKDRLTLKINRGSKAQKRFLKGIEKLIKKYSYKNDIIANELWVINEIYLIQNNYIKAFNFLKSKDYYKAWCKLEDCEISLHYLLNNFTVDKKDKYRIKFIKNIVRNWQGVFPYKIFGSPEILDKVVECSICGRVRKPRNMCSHRPGYIYHGQLCLGKVTDMEFLGLSFVENPVQKYSVFFPTNEETGEQEDRLDYSLVNFLIDRLSSPLDSWSYAKTVKRYTNSQLADYSFDKPCPCKSKKKHIECCYLKGFVDVPHIELIFEKQPPVELPNSVRGF